MGLLQWLTLAMLAFYTLPWLTAAYVVRRNGSKRPHLVFYRHFVVINLFLSSLVVGGRLLFMHPQVVQVSSALSVVEAEYGAIIIALGILTLFTVFQDNSLKLAAAIIWPPLLIILSVMHLAELAHMHTLMPGVIILHAINDLIVASTLVALGAWVYRKERRVITCFAGSVPD